MEGQLKEKVQHLHNLGKSPINIAHMLNTSERNVLSMLIEIDRSAYSNHDFFYLHEKGRVRIAKSIEQIEQRVRHRKEESYKIVWFGGITEFRLLDGKFRRVMPTKEDCFL